MPNRKLANEWLTFATKSLETAQLLNKELHYTDVIAIDIQQTFEKAFKAIYAFNGDKIPRTHSLEILYNYSGQHFELKNIEIKDIIIIDDYYQTERYPGPQYYMPERSEINKYLLLAKDALQQIKIFINS